MLCGTTFAAGWKGALVVLAFGLFGGVGVARSLVMGAVERSRYD